MWKTIVEPDCTAPFPEAAPVDIEIFGALLQPDVHDLAEHFLAERAQSLRLRLDELTGKAPSSRIIFMDQETVLWRPYYVVFATPIYM
jgi:hypothetical protein